MEDTKKIEENEKKLLIGLTTSGDGDLLHLSEGISNDLGITILKIED